MRMSVYLHPEQRQPREKLLISGSSQDDVIHPDDVSMIILNCSTIFGYIKNESSKDEIM
jgi:hypothetical protein